MNHEYVRPYIDWSHNRPVFSELMYNQWYLGTIKVVHNNDTIIPNNKHAKQCW